MDSQALEKLGFRAYEAEKFGSFMRMVKTLDHQNAVYVALKAFAAEQRLSGVVDLANYCSLHGVFKPGTPAEMRDSISGCTSILESAITTLSEALYQLPGYVEVIQKLQQDGNLDPEFGIANYVRKAALPV